MKEKYISPVNRSVADKYETCFMPEKSTDGNGNWTEDNLKESGIKTGKDMRLFAGMD